MYKSIDPNILERAGSFKLSQLYLISYASADGSGALSRMNIRELVREINIYEHLENTTLSGNIVITDATNVLQNFPVTGYERLEFKLETPGLKTGYDFSVESGYPMFVYAIDKRQQVNPRTQSYIIRFCSMENIKNQQTRIQFLHNKLNLFEHKLRDLENRIKMLAKKFPHKKIYASEYLLSGLYQAKIRLKNYNNVSLLQLDARKMESKNMTNGIFHST